MAASTAIGSWDQVFDAAAPWIAAMADQVRSRIVALHPAVVIVARPGDRAVSFGIGPAKMREAYAYLMPQRDWLNLGFYQGASLPDPMGLLEGTGKALRHLKLGHVKLGQAFGDWAAVDDLLRAALAERVQTQGNRADAVYSGN